jgi:hypothetical protein
VATSPELSQKSTVLIAKWWISAFTQDPVHILIDWDGISNLKDKVDPVIIKG